MTAGRTTQDLIDVLGELIQDSCIQHFAGDIGADAASRVAGDVIAAGWTPPRPALPEVPTEDLLDVLYGHGRKPGGAT